MNQRCLRNGNDFHIETATSRSTQNAIFNKGLRCSDKLPEEIKNENDIRKFMRLLSSNVLETF